MFNFAMEAINSPTRVKFKITGEGGGWLQMKSEN